MPLTHEDFMKLANGSDIRGVAVPGVPGEPVTLTPEAANRIAAGFVRLLAEKTGLAHLGARDQGLRAHGTDVQGRARH